MERLKHIVPTKEYEQQALEFIQEFYDYHSDINGTGGLDRYLDHYDDWLVKLEDDRTRVPSNDRVPARTFFLVRESDNLIVGMINIRLALNEKLKNFGGHIGYCIRPTQRNKGYNKVNLYLGLLCCKEHGIQEVLMDCDKDNPASSKTIIALGGRLIREYFEDVYVHCMVQDYAIDVEKAIKIGKEKYDQFLF